MPASTDCDKKMTRPIWVWFYLYQPGSLRLGSPSPTAACSGTLTALNFTEYHPGRNFKQCTQIPEAVLGQRRPIGRGWQKDRRGRLQPPQLGGHHTLEMGN